MVAIILTTLQWGSEIQTHLEEKGDGIHEFCSGYFTFLSAGGTLSSSLR